VDSRAAVVTLGGEIGTPAKSARWPSRYGIHARRSWRSPKKLNLSSPIQLACSPRRPRADSSPPCPRTSPVVRKMPKLLLWPLPPVLMYSGGRVESGDLRVFHRSGHNAAHDTPPARPAQRVDHADSSGTRSRPTKVISQRKETVSHRSASARFAHPGSYPTAAED